MTDLTGKTIANTYKQLLRVGVSTNTGVSAGLATIESGDGTNSSFQLATNSAKFTGTLVVDGATSIADNLHVDEKVCASAFYGDGSNISGVTATIAGNISVSNAIVGGNLYVSGTATIVGATHLQAALSVGGAAQFGSTVTVSGAAQLQSTVTAVGAATFKSTVTVENVAALKNNVTVGGTFNVAGASGFTSKATFSNDVSVSGRLDVATSVCIGSVLDVEGVANFATNISVSGNANIVGNVTAAFYYGDGSNLTNVEAAIGTATNIAVSGFVNVGGNLSVSGTSNVIGAASFQATVTAVGAATFKDDVSVSGNVDIAGNVSVGGTLFAAGGITYDGNVSVSGNLAVGGNVSVGGTLSVTGAVSLASTLSVGGATNLLGTVTATGNSGFLGTVRVSGATSLEGALNTTGAALFSSTVTVVGAGTFKSNVSVSGTTKLLGTVTATGNTGFLGTVRVSGATSLEGALNTTGAALFSSTVTVVGATHLQNTVSVAGGATFASTVTILGANLQAVNARVCAAFYYGDGSNLTGIAGGTISGNISVSDIIAGGTLRVSAATSLEGALNVTGAALFSSTVTVVGAGTFKSNISVSGNVDIAGNVSAGGTLNVGGNVGIGTTSPTHMLTVGEDNSNNPGQISLGRGGLETANIFFTRVGTNDAEITYNSDEDLYIKNNFAAGDVVYSNNLGAHIFKHGSAGASEAMRITSAGNVGIGISSPAVPLHISSATPSIRLTDTDDNSDAQIGAAGGGLLVFDADIGNEAAGSAILFRVDGGSEKMRIDSSGRVGIGKTSPSYDLDVDGTAALYAASTETRNFEVGYGRTGNGYSYIDLIGDATYTDYGLRIIRNNGGPNTGSEIIHRGTGGFALNSTDAGAILLKTSNTERMRITSSGNVGIGTSSPGEKLNVSTGGSEYAIQWNSTGSNNWVLGSASNRAYIANKSTPLEVLTLLNGGNVGIGTSSPDGKLNVQRTAASAGWIINGQTVGVANDSGLYMDASNNIELAVRNGSGTLTAAVKSSGSTFFNGGDVGIGTSSPTNPLHVVGEGTFTRGLELGINGVDATSYITQYRSTVETLIGPLTTRMLFGTVSNHDIAIQTNDTECMRITSSGNVGIGTTVPNGTLTLRDGVPRIDLLEVGGSAGFDNTVILRDVDVFAIQTRNGASFVSNDYRSTTNASGALTHEWRIANSEKMRIDSSGNVGINTQTPTRHLSVNGSIQFASGAVIEAGTSSLNTYIAGVEGASGRWAFATNGSERMRIISSGNIGIGTSSPSYKLHVAGDIYATGDVTAYSSAVAKDDITTIPDALDLVEQLRGVSFKWKESGKKAVGLIYEEVKEVIPELTSEKEGHVGVAYQNTVALLIEAVKTLSAKVKELETK